MDTKTESELRTEFARKGGKARVKNLTKKELSEAARLLSNIRWKKVREQKTKAA